MARGMRGGMDARMMKKLQKQMKSEDLDVTEVIFKMPGKNLVFRSPSVTAMNLMGQQTFQIIGEPEEMAPGSPVLPGKGITV